MTTNRTLSGPPEMREFWQDVFYGPRTPGNFRPFGSMLEDRVAPADSTATLSGVEVNPERALRLSAVWACVSLRSAVISSLPLVLRDKNKAVLTEHPLYRILHDQPNADMTASEFWEVMSVSLDLWGNAFALIDRNAVGDVIALTPLRPERVTVARSGDGVISYLYSRKDRRPIEFRAEEVFHLKGFTVDGLVGLSPLRYAAETIGAQHAANDAAIREFRNGLKVGGFLKTGNVTLQPEQRQRLRDNLGEFSSPENAAKWMVLEAGMEPVSANSIRMNPAEAQLLESRYFGIEEICRAFHRTPPQLIGHTNKASSWASSLENTNLGWMQYGLRPGLVRIEQSITKQLLRPEERGNVEPKFSVEGLLRADSQGRANYYRTMIGTGAMTINRARSLEDEPPVEGGDEVLVPLNMTTLTRFLAETPQPDPNAEPAPAPAGDGGEGPAAGDQPDAEAGRGLVLHVHIPGQKTTGFTITRDAQGNAVARPNPPEE